MNIPGKHPVILFDGVCNLCSGGVQYVIKHDPHRLFRFASLQSDFAKNILFHCNSPVKEFNSFVLLEDNKIYTRSTAALRVVRKLDGFVKCLYVFVAVPKFMRDAVYNIIAKNRYKWFGKKQSCWLPSPQLKSLFLDTI